jgi:hypothetical protein
MRFAKMSGEHLWSDWITKVLPPMRHHFTLRDQFGGVEQFTKTSLDLTAKVVCEQCNNGWMNDLENNEAKPALTDMIRYGNPVSLLPRPH